MAAYLPPTEDLPIFDTQVFDTANTSYLTYTEAKKYFVSYPIAQGTTTISDLIAGSITYLTPASGSFFNIGDNQVSGGTIRIGPSGGSTGVSVHAGNIDCKNNTINNATSGTAGTLTIGDLQTTGILNIGSGSRSGVGAINIGNNSNNTAPMNIGGENTASNSATTTSGSTVSFNGNRLWSIWTGDASIRSGGTLTLTSSSSANVNIATSSFSDVAIGSTTTTKNINIYNYFTNLRLASGYYITTNHSTSSAVTLPTTSQVGGVINGSDILSPTFPSTGNITSWASIDLPAGTWVITASRRYDNSGSSTRILWSFGTNLRNNAASPVDSDYTYGVTSVVLNSTNNYMTLTGTASLASSTTVYLNIYAQYSSAPSVSTNSAIFRAIRIA